MTLAQLGEKHQTDKGTLHDYWPLYTKHLGSWADREFTLVELGVWGGASMKVWRDYFPNARIIGVDVNFLCGPIDGVEFHLGDALQLHTTDLWKSIEGDLVVIDDASHILEQQAVCFARLGARASQYFIEDCAQDHDVAKSVDLLNGIFPVEVYDVRERTGRYDDIIIYKK